MRRLILRMLLTLDGVAAGEHGPIAQIDIAELRLGLCCARRESD
jgi:hypothetical protein